MDLTSYDVILVNSSAGKDSQAMLDYVAEIATAQGVRDRVVVVHCDLGRMEWPGVRELAEEQTQHYGFRFEVVTRKQGDLLTQVRNRRMWPSAKARYCTSDHKRSQVRRVMTQLVTERGAHTRILNCMGLRADESPARKKRPAFKHDAAASNGKRHVDEWLPIHAWTTDEVWARIKASGVRHHWAYDVGMPRLSCCFCIFAPKAALVLAGKHNPELLDEYVAVEREIGHTFKADLTLESVRDAVRTGAPVVQGGPQSWCM